MVPVSLVFWKLKPTQPQGRGGGYIGKDHRAWVAQADVEQLPNLRQDLADQMSKADVCRSMHRDALHTYFQRGEFI